MDTLMEEIMETVMNCGGSAYLADKVITDLINWGAVPAEQGAEFQKIWDRLKDIDNEEREDV
jgi:hypothetical protein